MDLLYSPRQLNAGTEVERIQPSFYKKIYEVKNSQLQLLMNTNKKEVLNDTHGYMNAP